MNGTNPAREEWKNRAREADILDVASRLGLRLRKVGRDHVASCPVCGGKDRNEFICTPGKNIFLCRKSGAGGDPIAMHMHVTGSDFNGAVEDITGEPAPDGAAGRRADPEVIREKRKEAADAQRRRDEENRQAERRKVMQAADVWAMRKPLRGTHGERYFKARGISLNSEEVEDLCFVPDLEYWGYKDAAAEKTELLSKYPCVIGAMRDSTGALVAVHRTYLDPFEPKKLKPPGDPLRNGAKKIVGKASGGFIRFGFIGQTVVIGEGIETVLSFVRLGLCSDDVTPLSGYSLGNIAGSATGTVPHPKDPKRSIPNGHPDLDSPGIVLPAEVEEVILLGDGDSDPEFTRASLLVALRRFKAQGKTVVVSFAPPGKDFNDLLLDGAAA